MWRRNDSETVRFGACRRRDVRRLDRANPSPSTDSFHARRFARQDAGDSTYLIAWRGGIPVGHAEIRWTGCADEMVRAAHPGCPEINGLEVFPESNRGNGIGTALIRECERWARRRGLDRVGLGVADDNPRAAALYRRLGYNGNTAYRDRYRCVDSLGTVHDFADPCVFLTRRC